MGFGNYEPRTYFKVKDGKIVVSIKKENEADYQELISLAKRTVPFLSKSGVPSLDIQLGYFEGYLTKIEVTESEFGKTWNVSFFDDDGTQYVWTNYYDGIMFQGFINCLASIEGKIGAIKIQPWLDKDKNGKDWSKITLYHNGNKLGWKYAPLELPTIVALKDEEGNDAVDAKGNVLYNKKKRMMWLINEVTKIQNKINQQTTPIKPPNGDSIGTMADEDLVPF